MKSFFHTLKVELIHHQRDHTRKEARWDIFEYVEIFYNRQRLHSSLGYLSPVDYETQYQSPKLTAHQIEGTSELNGATGRRR